MSREQIHFVTGRLAERALRDVLAELAPRAGFDYSIDVLHITVAALMTPAWIAPRLCVPEGATKVLLPGYCGGDLAPVAAAARVPVERGPKDLRELPAHFGAADRAASDYGEFDVAILAEINHAERLSTAELLAEAARLRADGADIIDVGCDPGDAWSGVGEAVRALRDAGHRVSIDSYHPAEIAPAVRAGAELVLSVNATNRHAAGDWGAEVVVVPDVPGALDGLDDTLDWLDRARVRWRIDPILEPIGFGFAASLARYLEVRRRYPQAEMLMGIGNLTELTDVDSAGVNVSLLGFCQEVGVRSVLTTQVINWARTSVRECDLGRRLVHYAVTRRVLPKHVEPRLIVLRDPRLLPRSAEELSRLAAAIKDHNYRLFAMRESPTAPAMLHLVSAGLHLSSRDPFDLFAQLQARGGELDPGHAFYLGYELAKAVTSLTLGKEYRQDEALDWGFLTRAETSHRARRTSAAGDDDGGAAG